MIRYCPLSFNIRPTVYPRWPQKKTDTPGTTEKLELNLLPVYNNIILRIPKRFPNSYDWVMSRWLFFNEKKNANSC